MTGWAGRQQSRATRTEAQQKALELNRAVRGLTNYFCQNVTLFGNHQHSPGHTRKIIHKLFRDGHSERDIRGMLEDVVYLSQEALSGRVWFRIQGAGLLPHLMEGYNPSTKKIETIWSRNDSNFDIGGLVVVGR